MMFAVGERQVFIINVCLSCLPSCLHLRYCEQLEKTDAPQNQVPDFPWCFTAQKKILLTVLFQIRREHQGRKENYYSRCCSGMPSIPSESET